MRNNEIIIFKEYITKNLTNSFNIFFAGVLNTQNLCAKKENRILKKLDNNDIKIIPKSVYKKK